MGAGRESSRRQHFALFPRAVTAASAHRFSVVDPDGAHPAGSAQPHQQPTKRNSHPNTGQPSGLAAVPGSAVSMQLEALTLSPQWTHSFVFAEADEERTEGALPWQQNVTLGADAKVVLYHALATSSGFCEV